MSTANSQPVANDEQFLPAPPELLQAVDQLKAYSLRYEVAMKLVLDKLDYISREYELRYGYALIDSKQSRIKSPESIVGKLKRKHLPLTFDAVFSNLHDIAGIRLIVRFLSDVKTVEDLLATQADIKVLKVKDYIHHPKPNGYQSLHLILGVPVYTVDGPSIIEVELQIRTIAMNFWASLEHELNYKKNVPHQAALRQSLTKKAQLITELDQEMDDVKQRMYDPERPPKKF
ncbi:GTP pyrophosphokinase [Lactiplantibacillus xiangfangensis]|uniref:GTP pyrophosphokinase n=1 Tax=Lactiplantibacillus xiangfangensis TaxID=942150 RepID=A0A0R2MEM9_9LACO|nr:GTP pyrophosphokinase [Lactiplantibacillus xiangfangensis]KRO10908.1 GTP pyrophosphokinase [Lactiplantibacillus xiangfangensis]